MSRRTIVMVAGAGVIVAAAIALAVMTRSEPAPLKPESQVVRESPISTTSTSTNAPTQNSSAAQPAIASSNTDVAEPGNGSTGELLERLADEYGQHHWANAIAACLNPEVAVAGAKQCAMSACELHDIVHARQFFSRVAPADRGEVRAECDRIHVPVDRPVRPQLGTHRRPFRSPIVSPAGSDG
jgi:hypothetical protein